MVKTPRGAALLLSCLILGLTVTACLESRADEGMSAFEATLAKQVILSQKCGTCHTLNRHGLQLRGRIGPDLSRQGVRQRSAEWLRTQLLDPLAIPDSEVAAGYAGKQKLMPPVKNLSERELEALVTFLQRLD